MSEDPIRVAYLSPLPPVRSGIADYSARLIPALARRCELTAVVDQPEHLPVGVPVIGIAELESRRAEFDAVLCHLGNNLFHEFVYREARTHPSVIVLHEVVLHHLVVEMTLARGDVSGYLAELRENHGEAGASWAEARIGGIHSEIGNFLFPASAALAGRSKRVVVHNAHAARELVRMGVTTPIDVVGHPELVSRAAASPMREETRARLGYSAAERVIGMFGFITSPKRPEVVIEAFSEAFRANHDLRLLIVGEPAPNVDIPSLVRKFGIDSNLIKTTGFVEEDDFEHYLAAVDRVVNLRYPTAGESSGPLIRVFAAGRPVAVSDYAQFGDFPAPAVVKIPLGSREVQSLASFLLSAIDPGQTGAAQQEWLQRHASLDSSADGFIEALNLSMSLSAGQTAASSPRRIARGTALFPSLKVGAVSSVTTDDDSSGMTLMLTNTGRSTIGSLLYGEPGYRLICKVFRGTTEVADRWITLGSDLRPGETTEIEVRFPNGGDRLELYHALQGIEIIDGSAFAVLDLAS